MTAALVDLPLTKQKIAALREGERVLLSGTVYTARDAAHERFFRLLDSGQPLPFAVESIAGACVYYAGPSLTPPGLVIGSCGPTSSYRMDSWTPRLLEMGLLGMIGKGKRSGAVEKAIREAGAVYFAATGGAGALLASRITECEVIAFPDLGAEAVRRLVVRDFPVTVMVV